MDEQELAGLALLGVMAAIGIGNTMMKEKNHQRHVAAAEDRKRKKELKDKEK